MLCRSGEADRGAVAAALEAARAERERARQRRGEAAAAAAAAQAAAERCGSASAEEAALQAALSAWQRRLVRCYQGPCRRTALLCFLLSNPAFCHSGMHVPRCRCKLLRGRYSKASAIVTCAPKHPILIILQVHT